MRVLVTGGAGFIGSHTVEALMAAGHEVAVLDNLSTGSRKNLPSQVRLIEADIRHDNLTEIFAQVRPEAVIHLAAQTMVPYSLQHPDEDADTNIGGIAKVLEACRNNAVKRVVFSSSAAVYGDAAVLPLTETDGGALESFYALSKLTSEKYLALYQHCYGLEYVVLRYANVYGERQGDGGEGGVVSIFARKIAAGEALAVFGDGEQTRDFIYVKDVAQANALAVSTAFPNNCYNVSTDCETSVNCLIETFAAAMAPRTMPAVSYQSAREGDIYRSRLDCTKAAEKMGFRAKTPLAEGIKKTLTYFLQPLSGGKA